MASWRNVGSKIAILTQNSGEVLQFDKVVVCWSGVAQSQSLEKDFIASLDPNTKHVNVDQYLRLTDNIFAAGDVTTADTHRAMLAWFQGELVLKNIVATISGKPLQAYKKGKDIGMLTLGVTLTMIIVGGWCLWANRLGFSMKAKVERSTSKELGQTWGLDTDWMKEFQNRAAASAAKLAQ